MLGKARYLTPECVGVSAGLHLLRIFNTKVLGTSRTFNTKVLVGSSRVHGGTGEKGGCGSESQK